MLGGWKTMPNGCKVFVEPDGTIRRNKIKDKDIEIKTYELQRDGNDIYKSKYLRDKKTRITMGQLDYKVNDKEVMVRMIKTYDQFKRRGIATKLLKDLQKEIGNKEINFHLVTQDGQKLLDKIANITEKRKDKYGQTYYKGKIK